MTMGHNWTNVTGCVRILISFSQHTLQTVRRTGGRVFGPHDLERKGGYNTGRGGGSPEPGKLCAGLTINSRELLLHASLAAPNHVVRGW